MRYSECNIVITATTNEEQSLPKSEQFNLNDTTTTHQTENTTCQ